MPEIRRLFSASPLATTYSPPHGVCHGRFESFPRGRDGSKAPQTTVMDGELYAVERPSCCDPLRLPQVCASTALPVYPMPRRAGACPESVPPSPCFHGPASLPPAAAGGRVPQVRASMGVVQGGEVGGGPTPTLHAAVPPCHRALARGSTPSTPRSSPLPSPLVSCWRWTRDRRRSGRTCCRHITVKACDPIRTRQLSTVEAD